MRQKLGTSYDTWWRAYRDQLQRRAAQRPASVANQRFVIPVVVHVIYDAPGNNIADEQIFDAIRILNEDYERRNADTADVIPLFKQRVGDTKLEFRLARRDPQGNCTNGITRTYSPLTRAADDNVKQLIAWDNDRYLNIWVVNNISFGAAGYAYLPCWVGTPDDGIVILNGYIGSIGNGSPRTSRALTHEVGHYLGLPHTWGGTNNPGPGQNNCADDDGVSDTPNTEGSVVSVCNLQLPACPGDPDPLSNVQNYMDYSYCSAMFTAGQAALMNDGLAFDFPCRTSLVTAQNLQQTGVADGLNLPPCAPVAAILPAGSAQIDVARGCVGDSIRFQGVADNLLPGTPVSWQWSFPGGSPATSTRRTPAVVYRQPGDYDVALTVTAAGLSGSTSRTGFVKVRGGTIALTPPVIEQFEDPAFPNQSTTPQLAWETSMANGAAGWSRTTTAAVQGTASAWVNLRTGMRGDVRTLVSPVIDVPTTLNSARLRFQVAYAQRSTTSNDELQVSYSLDCGRSWITRFRLAGSRLALGNPRVGSGTFVPTTAQWHDQSSPVGTLPAGTRLMVRFQLTGDLGNALYLDDVRLDGTAPLGLAAGAASALTLDVAPNPAPAGDATLHLSLPPAESATLRVYDAAGRLVAAPAGVRPGTAELPLTAVTGPLAPGFYLLELTSSGGQRRVARALVE